MASKRAHTDEEIIAAGHDLTRRGITPTQAKLYKALGKKGHPSTAWKCWVRYRDQQHPLSDDVAAVSEEKAKPSAEMAKAHEALQVLLDQQKDEVTAPYEHDITGLREALPHALAEVEELKEVIDLQHQELEWWQSRKANRPETGSERPWCGRRA